MRSRCEFGNPLQNLPELLVLRMAAGVSKGLFLQVALQTLSADGVVHGADSDLAAAAERLAKLR